MTPQEFASKHPTGKNDCYAALVLMGSNDYEFLYKAMEEYAKYYNNQLNQNKDGVENNIS